MIALLGISIVYASALFVCSVWLECDAAEILGGDQPEAQLIGEGMSQGMGTFFLTWIVTHTLRLWAQGAFVVTAAADADVAAAMAASDEL